MSGLWNVSLHNTEECVREHLKHGNPESAENLKDYPSFLKNLCLTTLFARCLCIATHLDHLLPSSQ